MGKQCVVNRDSEGNVESVVVKNYSKTDISLGKQNDGIKSQTPRELIKGLTDKLLQKNLVSKVSLFTNEQIIENLKDFNKNDIK